MLETIREFSVELLTDSGEEPDLRRLHAEWCADLSREFVNQVQVWQDLDTWSTRLDPELDNIRSAIAWLLQSGNISLLFSITTATEDYWQARPFMPEVCGWLERAFAATEGQVSYPRSLALGSAVVFWAYSGRAEEGLAMAETALREAEVLSDPLLLGRAHMACAVASEMVGEVARAAEEYAAARLFFQDESLSWYAFWADAELGDKLIWLGDLERGIPLLDKAIVSAREAKHVWGIANASLYRAFGAVEDRDFFHAIRLFDESHRIARESNDVSVSLGAVQGLANLALSDGRAELAARLLGAVETTRASIGIPRLVCQIHRDKAQRLLKEQLGDETFQREFEAGRDTAWEAIASEIRRQYLGVDDGGMP
jgi:tetratricopeptide (TPR) repeat protein